MVLSGILMLVLIALFSCASQQVAPEKPQEMKVAQAEQPAAPPPKEEKPKSLYDADVKPLDTC